jgi:beta-N-acetylhexosaminidase
VRLAALVQAVAALTIQAQVASLTPQAKAALVVVSGLPAPPGVAGVILPRPAGRSRGPRGALVFADQEGGLVKTFAGLPPWSAARGFTTSAGAYSAGLATGQALRRALVDVDLAPVLDSPDGPLASRHFVRQSLGVAFARGLAAGGEGACVKHFPGLGSTAISTDRRPHVDGHVRESELAGFRSAIRAGVPCVMTSNAFYDGAAYRASISPETYRLLRSLGFEGVAITDSLSIMRAAPVERWARRASRAGADLLLFTSPTFARRAIAALVPLARAGELDEHVARVLAWKHKLRG